MFDGKFSYLYILLSALAACGGEAFKPMPYELNDGARVRVDVPAGPYSAGARIPLTVHNEWDEEYVWNPCFRSLERRQGSTWFGVDESDRVCTAEGWILEPGRRTNATTDIPESVQAGEYRFLYGFSRLEGDRYVEDNQVSNSFIVTP
jgi:hypothetical protein